MTTDVLVATAGALVGLGLFVTMAARSGYLSIRTPIERLPSGTMVHVCVACVSGVGVWLGTGWTLAAMTIAAVSAMTSVGFARQRSRRDDAQIVEGIAGWTEQLRDMLAGSNGLEQTIIATAPHAPKILRPAVERLVSAMSYRSLPQALHRFGRDIGHPSADFVVAALLTASTRQVRELGTLLGHLASCARDESRMYTRVWVGRARTRSAVRIIAAVVTAFVAGLALVSPQYLSPYASAQGQVVLSCVVLVFFGSLLAMQRLSTISVPERFIGKRSEVSS